MKPSSVAALRAVAEALLPPCDERAAAAGAAGDTAAAALWAHTSGGDEVVYKVRDDGCSASAAAFLEAEAWASLGAASPEEHGCQPADTLES